MKKGTIALIIVLGILAVIIFACIGSYNGLVSLKSEVDNSFSNISVQLQRRADLIPNLVNTVKGYAAHETEVITAVSDARAKLAGANTPAEMAEADNELSSALSRLLVVVENYPDLKANTQFTALMDELAGTENRIAVARKDYNDTVTKYNKTIKTFPRVIFANIFGFESQPLFEADESAKKAPNVQF